MICRSTDEPNSRLYIREKLFSLHQFLVVMHVVYVSRWGSVDPATGLELTVADGLIGKLCEACEVGITNQ